MLRAAEVTIVDTVHSILVEMIEKWDKNYNEFNDDNKIDEIIQVIHEFILFSSSSYTSF